MRRKAMLKWETIRENTATSDGYTYKYTLLSSGDGMYSLKIVMIGVGGEMHSDTASVMTSDGGRAIAFYNRLVKNLATPSNLRYCIEDERL